MKKESFGFKLRKIYKKISLKEGASIPLLDKKSFDKVSHLFKHAHDNRAFMANKKDHTSYLALASTHFEINEVHSSMESLEANYNITPYNELKLKYHKGSLSQEESKEYELIRDNFTILATRKSDDIDVENANEKAIGVAYLTPKIANILYDYKHIFLIGSEIVEQLFQVDTMDFFDRKDLTPNDMLRYLLNYMEAMNISDLHLFALHDYKYAITGRINTKLISLRPKGLEYVVAEGLINAMRQEGQREPMQQEKEVRALIKAELNNGHSRNFRYHEIEQSTGNIGTPSVSIRRLASADDVKSLSNLNIMPKAVHLYKSVVQKNHNGVIVFSGAVNSGKTTTLYALLNYMMEKLKLRILTIEAPIEIPITGFIQMDILAKRNAHENVKVTMHDAMKFSLSHDPNAVLMSEIRTPEEIRMGAVELPRNGHIVATTLHANSNKACLEKIIESGGIKATELNDKVKLLINQKLIPKKCQVCRGSGIIIKKEKEFSCDTCGGSCVSGMLPLFEMVAFYGLDANDNIFDFEKLEKEGKAIVIKHREVYDYFISEGMMKEEDIESDDIDNINEYYNLKSYVNHEINESKNLIQSAG